VVVERPIDASHGRVFEMVIADAVTEVPPRVPAVVCTVQATP